MCWFSAEHVGRIEQAKAGERLAVKKMPWHSNWVVRETEFEMARACPVCLTDETRVLFRFAESQQALHFGSEAEAVFRMLKHPRRDIFEFADRSQIAMGDLPAGLIFDVLVVPGSEQLSAVLNQEPNEHDEDHGEKESLLARLMAHF
jgi:hypothetical protein